jgi:violaxanthin de-epoxidase
MPSFVGAPISVTPVAFATAAGVRRSERATISRPAVAFKSTRAASVRARRAPRAALPRDDRAETTSDSARRAVPEEDTDDDTQSSRAFRFFRGRVAAGATAFAACAAVSLASPDALVDSAFAKDLVDPRTVESGKCLLSRCQRELAECLVDEKCAESLVCLNSCFGKPDEADCQIKCGDLYASKAVQTFNTCAITTNDCVKQKQDTGEYPAPPLDALAGGFDATVFGKEKRWYIVAGLNKDFDVFDCQEHFFDAPDPEHLNIKINWRINRPNGQFYERSDIQTFYADARTKSVWHNNGNEYLHYQDDWYVPGFKKGEYVFVYYRGTNDAWDGYGGAVVYSTSPELKNAYVPELTEIAKKVGVDFKDFVVTDNTCKPEPKLEFSKIADLDTLGDDVIVAERELGRDVRRASGFVGKTVKRVAKEVGRDARKIETELSKDVLSLERQVEKDFSYESAAFKAEVKAIEDKLISFGPRFTALMPDNASANMPAKDKDFDEKAMEKAKAKLSKVEKQVRKKDAAAAAQ